MTTIDTTNIANAQLTLNTSIDALNTDLTNSLDSLNNAQAQITSTGGSGGDDVASAITQIGNAQDSISSFKTSISEVYNQFLTAIPQINNAFTLQSSISDNTLNNMNKQNKALEQEVDNKRRMTEINNYYGNMNSHINVIMRNLIIILAIIIIFTILSKKGIVPGNISTFITVICILVIIVYVIYSIYDVSIRDKFNFDEYQIPFDAKAMNLESSGNLTDIRKTIGNQFAGFNLNTCIGDDCCEPGTIYDLSRNACIPICPTGQVYKQIVNPTTGAVDFSCSTV